MEARHRPSLPRRRRPAGASCMIGGAVAAASPRERPRPGVAVAASFAAPRRSSTRECGMPARGRDGSPARSLAGDILLHPDFGYVYFASVFTELELPPDEPITENPCPAPSCVDLYRMHYDIAAGAELSQRHEAVPSTLAEAMAAAEARSPWTRSAPSCVAGGSRSSSCRSASKCSRRWRSPRPGR